MSLLQTIKSKSISLANTIGDGLNEYFGFYHEEPQNVNMNMNNPYLMGMSPYGAINVSPSAPEITVVDQTNQQAPDYGLINVPEMLEQSPECLQFVESQRADRNGGNGRPRPRGRNDGGRSALRTQTKLNIARFTEHPEQLDKIEDEETKKMYIEYLNERKKRLKWLAGVTSIRQCFFMKLVIVLMVILYVWEIIYNNNFDFQIGHPWLWGSVSPNTLLDCGAKYAPLIVKGEFWRLFTPIFLHVSLVHVLINLLSQLKVGPDLERTLGARRIIPIYLISGIGSNIVSTIFVPKQVTGGASGALFGLYGLLLVDLKKNWKEIISPMKDLVYIIITIIISCGLGILPGICNFAHIGGFVFGILAGIVFVPSSQELANERNQEQTKISKGRKFCVVLTLIIIFGLLLAGLIVIFAGKTNKRWCKTCENINCIRSVFGDWCGREVTD